jgi:hypothetical protein
MLKVAALYRSGTSANYCPIVMNLKLNPISLLLSHMKLKIIGNFLDDIKKLFDFLVKKQQVVNSGCKYEESLRRINLLEDHMLQLFGGKEYSRVSWFVPIQHASQGIGATKWHCDSLVTQPCKLILASSYPLPTEILMKRKHVATRDNHHLITNSEINANIEKGKYQVFVPNPGDIYVIPATGIHRMNQREIGNPHLCLRCWLY